MRLSDLTTMRVGGEIADLVEAESAQQAAEAYERLVRTGAEFIVLGGGSNTVASDDPFAGTALLMRTRGFEVLDETDDAVTVRAQAGETWDDLVAMSVERGWSGIEAMSGIPGSVGAAPIQNIGAYGQEVAETLVAVEFLSAETLEVQRLEAADLELEYRNSAIKSGSLTGLVLSVELRLRKADGQSAPIRYGQLATSLGAETGDRRPLADVRRSVLELRASKGMVLSDDPDSVSAGSFFTNPIVSKAFTHSLPEDAPRFAAAPKTRADDGETEAFKLSAAWLIERAGIEKGFSLGTGRAAISSKHTLAITNTGGATGEEIAELARYVQIRVLSEFGVQLVNEPVLVGLEI